MRLRMLDERARAFKIAPQLFDVAACGVRFSLSMLKAFAELADQDMSALAFGKLLSQFCLQALRVPQLVARVFPNRAAGRLPLTCRRERRVDLPTSCREFQKFSAAALLAPANLRP